MSRNMALCVDCSLSWEAYYIAVYENKGCCLLEEPETIFIFQKYVAYISLVLSISISSGSLPSNIRLILSVFVLNHLRYSEYALVYLVEALRYKPEGREFDSRWCHWNFLLTSFRPH